MDKITECPMCGINVYNRGEKNRKFKVRIKEFSGYPADTTMPCLMIRADCITPVNPEGRCPFETAEEQDKLLKTLKELPKISGRNTYE